MEPGEAAAAIHIALLPNGAINVNYQCPNMLIALGMLDVARAQILKAMDKPASPIVQAPAGFRIPN